MPVLLPELASSGVGNLLTGDRKVALWWGTQVECLSAVYRKSREGMVSQPLLDEARKRLAAVLEHADLIPAIDALRDLACRLLERHPLRAADAFQLAAALTWCRGEARNRIFVCLDDRLRAAALAEGFTVLPAA